jgi:hypothetical protein
LELKDWAKENRFAGKPWIVLGKGPTFSRRHEFDLDTYNKFSLNHVVRELQVEVAHIVDIDVAESCAASLLKNCQFLLMPRVPNVRHFPGEYLTLSDWCQCIPELAEMERQGRLVTYDFAHLDSVDPWTIVARYFSSEVALGILGRMGVSKVFSLGIDGGNAYSSSFADLTQATLLANGQPSFDLQFGRLCELAQQLKLEFSPLVPSTLPPPLAPVTSYPDTTVSAAIAQSQFEYQPLSLAQSPLSVPEKLQLMEQEIRQLRTNFYATSGDLQATAKELGIISDRLGWARDEIAEYRARVLELEKNMHTIVQSKTWKLGRVFTKPVEVLTRKTK